MRTLFGLVLLSVGFALGGYAYYPEAFEDRVRLVQLTRFLNPVPRDQCASEKQELRTFSPKSPLIGPNYRTTTEVAASSDDAPPVVTAHRYLVRPTGGNAPVIPASANATPIHVAAATPGARAARAADVQEELKRVGCYRGYIDGDWGPSSKRAMQAFLRKVNASLPIDQPDEILLSLLRSHPDDTCARGCPAGQTVNDSGQCVPETVSASASDGRSEADSSNIETSSISPGSPQQSRPNSGLLADAAGPRSIFPGRMSVGGPMVTPPGRPDSDFTAPLPQLKPAPKPGEHEDELLKTAAAHPTANADPEADAEEDPVRQATKPRTVKKQRASSGKRYRSQNRQSRMMRQVFGDIF